MTGMECVIYMQHPQWARSLWWHLQRQQDALQQARLSLTHAINGETGGEWHTIDTAARSRLEDARVAVDAALAGIDANWQWLEANKHNKTCPV